jgi:hypothetical protein
VQCASGRFYETFVDLYFLVQSFLRAVHAFRNSHRTLIGPSSEMSNFRAAGRGSGVLPSDLTVSVGMGETRSARTGTGRSGQFAVHVELQQVTVRNTDGVDIEQQTLDGLGDSYGDGGNSEQGKNDLTGTSSCYEQDQKGESDMDELGTETGGAVIGIVARAEGARREQTEEEMLMDEEERASRAFTRQI